MDYTKEFETFWKKYPARWNRNISQYVKRKKRPAFEKWQKLSPEIQNECLAKVKYIKKYDDAIRDPVTWLNQCGWEDFELEKPKPIVTSEQAEEMLHVVKFDEVDVNDERNKQRKGLGL